MVTLPLAKKIVPGVGPDCFEILGVSGQDRSGDFEDTLLFVSEGQRNGWANTIGAVVEFEQFRNHHLNLGTEGIRGGRLGRQDDFARRNADPHHLPDRGWHQRLMLLATISLLQAAVARIFFVLITGGGPGLRPGLGPPPPLVVTMVPGLLLELFIVAGMIHDWRRHGRPHPAWIVGAIVTTAVMLLRVPLASSQPWLDFASFMAGFAG